MSTDRDIALAREFAARLPEDIGPMFGRDVVRLLDRLADAEERSQLDALALAGFERQLAIAERERDEARGALRRIAYAKQATSVGEIPAEKLKWTALPGEAAAEIARAALAAPPAEEQG